MLEHVCQFQQNQAKELSLSINVCSARACAIKEITVWPNVIKKRRKLLDPYDGADWASLGHDLLFTYAYADEICIHTRQYRKENDP